VGWQGAFELDLIRYDISNVEPSCRAEPVVGDTITTLQLSVEASRLSAKAKIASSE
jgi:hypothetical protein